MKSPTPHLDTRTGKLLLKDPGRFGQQSIFIFENEVWFGVPDTDAAIGGTYAGVSAEVVTQGQITQRITATRMVTLGIFALAAPKKSGNQQFLLSVTGPSYTFSFESGALESMRLKLLNQYAQIINNKAASSRSVESPSARSAADELGKWADLRSRGVITDEEYEAKKAQLLA